MLKELREGMDLLPVLRPLDSEPFMRILKKLEVEQDDDFAHAVGTDGARLIINFEKFQKMEPLEIVYSLVHEAWHIILEHPIWINLIPEELRNVYMRAADLRVNDLMWQSAWPLAHGVLRPGMEPYRFMPSGLSTVENMTWLFSTDRELMQNHDLIKVFKAFRQPFMGKYEVMA